MTVIFDSLVLVFLTRAFLFFPSVVGFFCSPLTILHYLFARNATFQELAHRTQLDYPRSLGGLPNPGSGGYRNVEGARVAGV